VLSLAHLLNYKKSTAITPRAVGCTQQTLSTSLADIH
jgi:hypothetical protein